MKAYLEIVDLKEDIVTASSGNAPAWDPNCADDGCITDQDLLL